MKNFETFLRLLRIVKSTQHITKIGTINHLQFEIGRQIVDIYIFIFSKISLKNKI